jgi:hypothetical protein
VVCVRVTVGEKKKGSRGGAASVWGKAQKKKRGQGGLPGGVSGEWGEKKRNQQAAKMNKNQRDERVGSPPSRPARRCYDCLAMGRGDMGEEKVERKKRERERSEREVKGRTRRWLFWQWRRGFVL